MATRKKAERASIWNVNEKIFRYLNDAKGVSDCRSFVTTSTKPVRQPMLSRSIARNFINLNCFAKSRDKNPPEMIINIDIKN